MADTALNMQNDGASAGKVSGEFIDFAGGRYYAIRNVDKMPPFFVSVISNVDHWLFVSSTGGLTAGRVSPETALFPYVTVDKIHDSLPHTGPKTVLRVRAGRIQPTSSPSRIRMLSRSVYERCRLTQPSRVTMT